jgi:hypothetical protein
MYVDCVGCVKKWLVFLKKKSKIARGKYLKHVIARPFVGHI